MREKTISERIGRDIAAAHNISLGEAVREKAAICLLDALGLAVLSKEEETAARARQLCAHTSDDLSATLWTTGERVAWSDACLANGVGAHAHFHDDSDPASWCHPGSLVVPAAVAATELAGGTLDDVLRAIAVGYATINWLGADEILAHALIARGVRTSPSLGSLAAAAAAASALKLDATGGAHAVAIAASMTGGVLEPLRVGSDEWRIQNGNAARLGLTAALYARQGAQGALSSIEGPRGILRALAGMEHIPAQWEQPLSLEKILKSYAKPWATLGDNMAAVRAAKLMHMSGMDARRIVKGRIVIWHKFAEYPGTSYKGPFDRPIQALASTAFATAGMLLLGDLEYDVSYLKRKDADILKLVECLEVIGTKEGTKLDSELQVWLDDGSCHTTYASDAPDVWLYHDRPTSLSIFERRLAPSVSSETARAIGTVAFDSNQSTVKLTDWLARLG